MQVVTGYQNGFPLPGGIAKPPFLGGYKYGGLAIEVGGWATDRQPSTVKRLFGNLNCGLGTDFVEQS